jgi:phosphoglycerol transferase MdoB-like AlkP superfamily enzyme
MINDFIEWKKVQGPFVSDDEFFKERYDTVDEIPQPFKDIFLSMYVLNHKLNATMQVVDSILDHMEDEE